MSEALRILTRSQVIQLSEALDFQNRTFQLAHVICFVELSDVLANLTSDLTVSTERAVSRCHVELANYFAAAVLMLYDSFMRWQNRLDMISIEWPPHRCFI